MAPPGRDIGLGGAGGASGVRAARVLLNIPAVASAGRIEPGPEGLNSSGPRSPTM